MSLVTFTLTAPTVDVNGNPFDSSLIASYSICQTNVNGVFLADVIPASLSLVNQVELNTTEVTYYAARANLADGRVSAFSTVVALPATLVAMPVAPGLSIS